MEHMQRLEVVVGIGEWWNSILREKKVKTHRWLYYLFNSIYLKSKVSEAVTKNLPIWSLQMEIRFAKHYKWKISYWCHISCFSFWFYYQHPCVLLTPVSSAQSLLALAYVPLPKWINSFCLLLSLCVHRVLSKFVSCCSCFFSKCSFALRSGLVFFFDFHLCPACLVVLSHCVFFFCFCYQLPFLTFLLVCLLFRPKINLIGKKPEWSVWVLPLCSAPEQWKTSSLQFWELWLKIDLGTALMQSIIIIIIRRTVSYGDPPMTTRPIDWSMIPPHYLLPRLQELNVHILTEPH